MKKTVESAGNFDGYEFLSSEELEPDADALAKLHAASKTAAFFLTLQDLQGGHERKAQTNL